jgi:hypothetical protein
VTAAEESATPSSAHASAEIEAPAPIVAEGDRAEKPASAAPKAETAEPNVHQGESAKPDAPRIPGKLMIVSSANRAWDQDRAGSKEETVSSEGVLGKRRIAALAAVIVLAVIAGAVGGALATAGMTRSAGADAAIGKSQALEASIARIDADIQTLKTSVEHTTKVGMSQFNKTSDRLDKVEKAQIEPAVKLAKLSEAVDKLRATTATPAIAQAPAPAPATAKEVTGSVPSPQMQAAAAETAAAPGLPSTPRVEVGRLPTVEGWRLRDVANGSALIEGRQGIYEVYAGDPVPGLGRVDAIRRQDGHWVVVTSKGLIVSR